MSRSSRRPARGSLGLEAELPSSLVTLPGMFLGQRPSLSPTHCIHLGAIAGTWALRRRSLSPALSHPELQTSQPDTCWAPLRQPRTPHSLG